MKTINADYLKTIFDYSPEAGELRWIASPSGPVKAGSIAGAICNGYIQVGLGGTQYKAHRLIWMMINGDWPVGVIDHIDGNPMNNRISNLRDVDRQSNMQNIRKAMITNQGGVLGAHKIPSGWRSVISLNGKTIHLGVYKTPEEAHARYLEEKRIIHAGCTI